MIHLVFAMVAVGVFVRLLSVVSAGSPFHRHLTLLPVFTQLGDFFIELQESYQPFPVESVCDDGGLNRTTRIGRPVPTVGEFAFFC